MGSVRFCRGPLRESFPAGTVFCAPDADVPWLASGLAVPPRLSQVPSGPVSGVVVVYLEAHRAPSDMVLSQLEGLGCDVVVQGDPEAPHHNTAPAICAALMREDAQPWPVPHMDYYSTVCEAVSAAAAVGGDWRVLASCGENAQLAHEHLRGSRSAVLAGDLVLDRGSGCLHRVRSPASATVGKGTSSTVELDDGRRVRSRALVPMVVQTSWTIGSGECDVLVLLPDLADCQAWRCMRRVRHAVIGVGWHPSAYVPT